MCHDVGMPDITLHRLRHTIATALVRHRGYTAAQHRLGHAEASTTLRIYAHAGPQDDIDAAATVERLLS
jgi:integrase